MSGVRKELQTSRRGLRRGRALARSLGQERRRIKSAPLRSCRVSAFRGASYIAASLVTPSTLGYAPEMGQLRVPHGGIEVFDDIATSDPSKSNRPRSRRGLQRDWSGSSSNSRVIALLAAALILSACGSSAPASSAPAVATTPMHVPTSAAGDPLGLIGDWNVIYGAPTTLTISYANAASTPRPR